MKLLRVISSANPEGGGPIEGLKQMQGPLQDFGVEVEVACMDAPDAPWLAATNLPVVHALGPAKSGYGYTPRLLPWLRKNAMRFDAVIVHGLWQYHGLAVRQALRGTGTPYFVFTHGMLDPWFKRTYPLKHLKKWLYWPWAEYRVLRDARAVIFTCEEERLLARESFWLYRVREAVTLYGTAGPVRSSSDLRDEFLRNRPELRHKRLFLFLGRMHQKKGCDLLLRAFAQVAARDQRLQLVMAGPLGDWGTELQALASELGIEERVSWTGMLQADAKWAAYAAAEVFCLPSHQENFGIVVAEALACATPVLISNKVNIWREVEAAEAGFVAEDTLEGTVANLTRWINLGDEERRSKDSSALSLFQQRFRIDKAARRLLDIVEGAA